MNYKEEVTKYGKQLEEFQQKELLSAIRNVIADGLTYEWVYTALNHKKPDVWRKYGFGLFMDKGFRTEIKNKMIKLPGEAPLFSEGIGWDSLPDDSPSSIPLSPRPDGQGALRYAGSYAPSTGDYSPVGCANVQENERRHAKQNGVPTQKLTESERRAIAGKTFDQQDVISDYSEWVRLCLNPKVKEIVVKAPELTLPKPSRDEKRPLWDVG